MMGTLTFCIPSTTPLGFQRQGPQFVHPFVPYLGHNERKGWQNTLLHGFSSGLQQHLAEAILCWMNWFQTTVKSPESKKVQAYTSFCLFLVQHKVGGGGGGAIEMTAETAFMVRSVLLKLIHTSKHTAKEKETNAQPQSMTSNQWTLEPFQRQLWGNFWDRVEHIWVFPSTQIPLWTELNWTELNWTEWPPPICKTRLWRVSRSSNLLLS